MIKKLPNIYTRGSQFRKLEGEFTGEDPKKKPTGGGRGQDEAYGFICWVVERQKQAVLFEKDWGSVYLDLSNFRRRCSAGTLSEKKEKGKQPG